MKNVIRLFVVVALAAASVPALAEQGYDEFRDEQSVNPALASTQATADRTADEEMARDGRMGAASGEPEDTSTADVAEGKTPRDAFGNAPWEQYSP